MSFAIILKFTFKSRVCFRVFCHGIVKGGDCKVVIPNYVLFWLYSMTKSVVIVLILFPCIFVGFICNEFSMKWWRFDQDS